MAELTAMTQAIYDDPASRCVSGFSMYSKPAQKKLNDIARAITWHLADNRAERGDPVDCSGYSGRQSNRRR